MIILLKKGGKIGITAGALAQVQQCRCFYGGYQIGFKDGVYFAFHCATTSKAEFNSVIQACLHAGIKPTSL